MPSRVTLVWIVLVLATAATWLVGVRSDDGAAAGEPNTNPWILLIAGLKVWLVMDWFMELREAGAGVRWAAMAWLLALLAILSALAS